MEKDLIEIERTYCGDVIQFFIREYLNIIKRNDVEVFRNDLQTRLSSVIEKRLLNTGLVINYRVEVIAFPLSEKRNHKIDNILTDEQVNVVDRIMVSLQYRNHQMVAIEHLIKF